MNIGDIWDNRKYLAVYTISLIFLLTCFYTFYNYVHLKFDIIILDILLIGGFFVIIFYSKTKNLHKTCFIILLIFGTVMCLTSPAFTVCDEIEHYARSDLTAQGILFPEYINNEGYAVSSNFNSISLHRGENLLNSNLTHNENINENHTLFNGCFPQNPFYPYLISGFGIIISNLMNLNVMWSLYIGRFFNLLFYCAVCTFAIKKSPQYKLPIFLVSCIPLAVYQAASFSVDGFIISMTLLAVAYFIKMYNEDVVSNKDMAIFFGSIFLVSLLKLPYILLIFLIYFIKKEKFNSQRSYQISRILPIILIILCSIYSLNSSELLKNSLRDIHFKEFNVNPKNQFINMVSHPFSTILLSSSILSLTLDLIIDLFRFSYEIWIYESPLLALFYLIFFSFFSITYNSKDLQFERKHKVFLASILLLIYIGIIFIQYLSWAPFAYQVLNAFIGVYSRYFIQLLVFLPIIFYSKRINSVLNINNYNLKIITGCLIFLSGTVILTLSTFY